MNAHFNAPSQGNVLILSLVLMVFLLRSKRTVLTTSPLIRKIFTHFRSAVSIKRFGPAFEKSLELSLSFFLSTPCGNAPFFIK